MLLCMCQRVNKSIHKLAFIWLLIKVLQRCQNSQICEENAKKPGQVCLFKLQLHVNMKEQNSTNRNRPPTAVSLGDEITFTRVRSVMFVVQESVSIQGQRPSSYQSLNKFLEKNQCTFCSFTRSPYRPLENVFYNEKEQEEREVREGCMKKKGCRREVWKWLLHSDRSARCAPCWLL